MSQPYYENLTPRQRRRQIIFLIGQSAVWAVVSLLAYFLLPLERPEAAGIVILIGGLVLLAVVLTVQVRSIMGSKYPRVKAIGALGVGLPLLLVVFAAVYFLTDNAQPGSFTQPLDKTGALYFTITVFSTVGFGDIAPVSGAARLIVSVQMLLDLIVLGIVAKLIVGAVQVGLARKTSELSTDTPAAVDRPRDT